MPLTVLRCLSGSERGQCLHFLISFSKPISLLSSFFFFFSLGSLSLCVRAVPSLHFLLDNVCLFPFLPCPYPYQPSPFCPFTCIPLLSLLPCSLLLLFSLGLFNNLPIELALLPPLLHGASERTRNEPAKYRQTRLLRKRTRGCSVERLA